MKTFLAAALIAASAHAAEPVALDPLLRRAQYDDLSISPNGQFLTATVTLDDRTMLVVVKRADFSISTTVDPGKDGFVDGVFWASDNRLFVASSKREGNFAGKSQIPATYAIDADGKNRSMFAADVVDTLRDDPAHMLVSWCTKWDYNGHGCLGPVVRKVDKTGSQFLPDAAEEVAKAPVPNAQFTTDRDGNVRFCWASDEQGLSKLFVKEGESWRLLNDESKTHLDLTPAGDGPDANTAYLLAERGEGTDAIERYDFKTGERTEVLRDERSDPLRLLRSLDGRTVIGALYGDGRASARFIEPAHPDAAVVKDLIEAFPGETAVVTSGTKDGAFAIVTVVSDRDPGRFYLYERASGSVKLLNVRRPWLDAKQLATMKPVELKARDGVALHGYLSVPPGSDGKNLPLVVLAHGGPYWIRDDWGFDEDTQILAAHGYAVLRVNFRGSSGYGRHFHDLGFGQWGGAMQDDLTDATKWAIDEGVADRGRVCLYGASYGGYAALMGAVREPDLYRCVISVAGPTDLSLVYEWGDTHRSRWGRNYLERAIGKDKTELARRSPARHATEIKADVMLVQGGRDYRVSPEHAKVMRAALEKAGKRYEGFFPSYEPHGIVAPKDQQEFYDRLVRFLDARIGKDAKTTPVAASG